MQDGSLLLRPRRLPARISASHAEEESSTLSEVTTSFTRLQKASQICSEIFRIGIIVWVEEPFRTSRRISQKKEVKV